MKKHFIIPLTFFLLLFTFCPSNAQEKSKEMYPTSSSEKAVELFGQSMRAAENADLNKSRRLLDKALEEDPDFFMAHFQHAFFSLFFGNREQFENHAENAVAVDHDLNKAEQLLKDALVKLKENPEANPINIGKKLVELYPKDKNPYFILGTFQSRNEDFKGAINTYKKGIKNVDNPAPFYNMLGYLYMRDGQMKKAEKAFDKYIEMEPHHPNPYDSKGDYYMQNQEYEKAYGSYIKAHELDPGWRLQKAKKAKKKMNESKMSVAEMHNATESVPGLKTGVLIRIYIVSVELNNGNTMEEWQDYFSNNILPEISKVREGWNGYLLNGVRGKNKNELGILYVIKSEKHWDKYYNEDGSPNELGMKTYNSADWDGLRKIGKYSSVYTDWLVID